MSTESFAGRLLVATATLQDPNFARTVVMIGMHGEQGALGLVLNRPSSASVAEAVPQLATLLDDEEPVYVGGPVQPGAIVVLCEFLDPAAAGMLVMGRIGLPGPDVPLEQLGEATERRRVFAGYAGWGKGQLDAEIEAGDWIAHDPEP
ncbi:MAG: YqgE/AlgH family protein, partial [Solirubrobacteraceae bacterium]